MNRLQQTNFELSHARSTFATGIARAEEDSDEDFDLFDDLAKSLNEHNLTEEQKQELRIDEILKPTSAKGTLLQVPA